MKNSNYSKSRANKVRHTKSCIENLATKSPLENYTICIKKYTRANKKSLLMRTQSPVITPIKHIGGAVKKSRLHSHCYINPNIFFPKPKQIGINNVKTRIKLNIPRTQKNKIVDNILYSNTIISTKSAMNRRNIRFKLRQETPLNLLSFRNTNTTIEDTSTKQKAFVEEIIKGVFFLPSKSKFLPPLGVKVEDNKEASGILTPSFLRSSNENIK